jgi:putative membrane protein
MTNDSRPRQPRVFDPNDPALVTLDALAADSDGETPADTADAAGPVVPVAAPGARWGALLLSAVGGLILLAAASWALDFALSAIRRGDVLGQVALVLIAIALFAFVAIVVREVAGLARLGRLSHLRREIAEAVALGDVKRERAALGHLSRTLAGRPDLRWALARLREHEQAVADPGDLARLADRELLLPLDRRARRVVLTSAKRVSLVTAISPLALVDVLFVFGENLRMLRTLAALYGGRPGVMAALKLGRMVFAHLVATGGVALTDDLLGQVLGHDLIRRLSRRLGEGVFNGAMTARIGAAAIAVIRPLPFIEAPPVRARDFLAELFRRSPPERRP